MGCYRNRPNSPGKLLKFRALVTMVADSTLAFNFEDNWGAKGYGTLHKINDGRNQLQLTLRDAPNQTEVSYLYDIYSLLKTTKKSRSVLQSSGRRIL